jgi:opacity protein-like surface antigen
MVLNNSAPHFSTRPKTGNISMHLTRERGQFDYSGIYSGLSGSSGRMAKPFAKILGMLGPFAAFAGPFSGTPEALADQPIWNPTQMPSTGLQWSRASTDEAAGRPVAWQTRSQSEPRMVAWSAAQQTAQSSTSAEPPTSEIPPSKTSSEAPSTSEPQSPWIVGIGGGAASEPDPSFALVYGRLGLMLDRNASLSLRPRYIFGNTDRQGRSNNEGVFQLPMTLDIQPSSWLSPYIGGGISTNTDSTGQTNGMLSLGADIAISRNLAIDLSVNYILQPNANDSNGGDFELTSVLYLRF